MPLANRVRFLQGYNVDNLFILLYLIVMISKIERELAEKLDQAAAQRTADTQRRLTQERITATTGRRSTERTADLLADRSQQGSELRDVLARVALLADGTVEPTFDFRIRGSLIPAYLILDKVFGTAPRVENVPTGREVTHTAFGDNTTYTETQPVYHEGELNLFKLFLLADGSPLVGVASGDYLHSRDNPKNRGFKLTDITTWGRRRYVHGREHLEDEIERIQFDIDYDFPTDEELGKHYDDINERIIDFAIYGGLQLIPGADITALRTDANHGFNPSVVQYNLDHNY